MKNGWRIILIIAAAAILLGCVCFGVGVLTGAVVAFFRKGDLTSRRLVSTRFSAISAAPSPTASS